MDFCGIITAQFDCPAFDERTANVTYQIPDDAQCDKYYVCIDGVPQETLCEDGLVFDPHRRSEHKCDLPYLVDCTGREKLRKLSITTVFSN